MSGTDTQHEAPVTVEATETASVPSVGPLPDETAVRAFLRETPEFFERHPDLLMRLKLPHDGGGAISLIERKLRLLNDEIARLRADRHELVQIARDNATLHARVYALAIDLISAADFESLCVVLTEGLREDFNADAVTTWLLSESGALLSTLPEDLVPVTPDSPAGQLLTDWLRGGARCGRFSAEVFVELFGPQPIGSAVVLPFEADECSGLVAIGANDPARFASGLATDALEFLVAVAAAKIGASLI